MTDLDYLVGIGCRIEIGVALDGFTYVKATLGDRTEAVGCGASVEAAARTAVVAARNYLATTA